MPLRQGSLLSSTVNPTDAAPQSSKKHERTVLVLNNAIDTINLVRELVPLDLARGVLATVAGILTIVKDTIVNQDDFGELADQCHRISLVIWRATSSIPESEISPAIQRALSELEQSVNEISDAVNQKKKKRFTSKVLRVTINKDIITGWQKDLDRFLAIFNTELNITANVKLDELRSAFEEFRRNVNMQGETPVPDALPAKPAIFLGRDILVRDAISSLLANRYVALIGPGGMGKTSIARAVVNDDDISKKFLERRYFVRFDDIDASQINYATFLDRIARALGISSSKANTHTLISKSLLTSDTLLILDNAETFLDAEKDAGRIIESIDDFGARSNVSIMLTTRTAGLPPNLTWERLRVPALEESAACEAFKMICHSPIEPVILSKLLSSVDFHPLSINLLAQVAVQNEWSPEELVGAWDRQNTLLLEQGSGKIQSIAVTVELSLNSPSLRKLGNVARHVMQIIAYLPQGLNKKRITEMFPSDPAIVQCIETLCKYSLAYHKGDFITMLAPIRLYMSTKYNHTSHPDIPLLSQVQTYYQTQLQGPFENIDQEFVRAEDVNIEHVLALALSTPADRQTFSTTYHFVTALIIHKPRPTVLLPIVMSARLQTSSSPLELFSCLGILDPKLIEKGHCLNSLGGLSLENGQLAEAQEAFELARDVYLSCGLAGRAHLRLCDITMSEGYYAQGNYLKAEAMYRNAIRHRTYVLFKGMLDDYTDAFMKMRWAEMKALRGEPGAVELCMAALKYYRRIESVELGIQARWTAGYAELWDGNYKTARQQFEDSLPETNETDYPEEHIAILVAMADVSYCQGNKSEAAKFREQGQDCIRRLPDPDIPYAVRASFVLAAHTAVDGDVEQARQYMHVPTEKVTRSMDVDSRVMNCLYIAACIELHGDDLSLAAELFSQTVDYCKAFSEWRLRAQALGGLGEIALRRKDTVSAKARFDEAKTLCDFMGVKPECLYTHDPYYMLSHVFKGWALLYDGHVPAS